MRSCFSYGWDVLEAYHLGMSSINKSLNMLHLRMQEPWDSYDPIPTQKEFINCLQWPTNKPFYSEWEVVMLVEMG